ncbi:ABC transporter permease [Rugosimonospora acidiphila]|uniref:Transport permease protein n=1 Tax=Rugosimonospora acidiphila TaxID=556531 RepID=A0ABP9RNG6_9ACTN
MATSTATVRRGPGHAARIGWERGKLEVKEFFRQRESVVFTLAFPVILLLIFGSVLNYDIPGNINFSQYFVPGILATGLFGVCFQTLAIQIAIERDKGILKRLEGTPMPPASYFLGKIVMVLTMVVLESIVLLAISSALGKVTLPSDWHRWVTFVWVTVAGVAAGSLLGIAFSSVPRSGKSAPATITPIALVLQFLSGVYFVFTDLPSWLQHVGALFPLKWIAQGYRSVFLPDSFAAQEPAHAWEHGRLALILVLWAVGGLVVAIRTFRWRAGKDA